MEQLFICTYGSHLYGTFTATSDLDEKAVYLPPFKDVLLGRKLSTFKKRTDAKGNPIVDGMPMPAEGTEMEFIPLQTFCRDFLNGQTYALEIAFAHLQFAETPHYWVRELVERFLTSNVASMVGFAKKQTMDYVHRGERLNAARKVMAAIKECEQLISAQIASGFPSKYRLDQLGFHDANSNSTQNWSALDKIAHLTGLEIGSSVNGGRTMRTLKLNGREYLETTELSHLALQLQKVIDAYGERTNQAAGTQVDLKSLSHAVRVYEQAIELLQTETITFPRRNSGELLAIKQGITPLEQVREKLLDLEQRVETAEKLTKIQKKTPKLEAQFDDWLLELLESCYGLC